MKKCIGFILPAIIFLAPFGLFAQQPGVRYISPSEHKAGPGEKTEENWNSHIDNQAYLRDYKERRRVGPRAPVIIINRNSGNCCQYRYCDSWGVDYRTGSSSFTYYENYRPNRYHPIYIYPGPHPGRPTPYIRKEKKQRVWGTNDQP